MVHNRCDVWYSYVGGALTSFASFHAENIKISSSAFYAPENFEVDL